MIELSMLLPVLLLMSFGVFEVGRAVYSYIAVVGAARDGARVAMDAAKITAEISAAVKSTAAPLTVADADIVICRGQMAAGICAVDATGEVNVSVTYRFETPVPLVSQLWGGGQLPIRRTMVSRTDPGAG